MDSPIETAKRVIGERVELFARKEVIIEDALKIGGRLMRPTPRQRTRTLGVDALVASRELPQGADGGGDQGGETRVRARHSQVLGLAEILIGLFQPSLKCNLVLANASPLPRVPYPTR
ncbi:MAG: hypothetical protein HY327_11350 [Chloroflexi bacterium]|nr:hypothetical protein [Chloroflexota bacterium]